MTGVIIRGGETQRQTRREDRHMTTEEETEIMKLQGKECQGYLKPPEAGRSRMEPIFFLSL